MLLISKNLLGEKLYLLNGVIWYIDVLEVGRGRFSLAKENRLILMLISSG